MVKILSFSLLIGLAVSGRVNAESGHMRNITGTVSQHVSFVLENGNAAINLELTGTEFDHFNGKPLLTGTFEFQYHRGAMEYLAPSSEFFSRGLGAKVSLQLTCTNAKGSNKGSRYVYINTPPIGNDYDVCYIYAVELIK